MGRIVKGAQIATERYQLNIPEFEMDDAIVSGDDPLFPSRDFDRSDSSSESESIEPAVPPIDLEAVRAQADALIESGRREAELLVAAAKSQGHQLLAQAQADAVAMGAKAQSEGTVAGLEAGRAEAAEHIADGIATLADLIESARAQRREIVDGAEPELLKLAMAIAERIVHREIEIDPEIVTSMVRVGLARLSGREKVTIRVNPGDVATMREHRETLLSNSDVESLRVVEDQRVDRGGVVIETESGTIDAKIGTQLREARRVLSPDEPVALPTPGGSLLHSSAQAS